MMQQETDTGVHARRTAAAVVACVLLGHGLAWAAPVERRLAEAVAAAGAGGRVRAIFVLGGSAPSPATPESPPGTRREALVRGLREAHDRAAAEVLPALRQSGASGLRSLWILNAVAARVPASSVAALAQVPGVVEVRLDATVSQPVAVSGEAAPAGWNLAAIRAPELWGLGPTGAGITVAILDTGVDAAHVALGPRWRGGAGGWFDAYGQYAQPRDNASGHGTQVAGLIVGGDEGGAAIGVAPGASWIAARIFDDAGEAPLSAIHAGFQWALDPDGEEGTDDAPQVVNASFGFPLRAGECYTEFESDIALLREAGIAVVFSGGNSGPAPLTSVSPGNNAGALPVGAVERHLAVPIFSSRGPSACSGGVYPAIVAPGMSVLTSDITAGGAFPGASVTVTGTSFAAPHVAGLLALLAGAYPGAGTAALEEALVSTALDLGDPGPDNAAGNGLPDAVRAWRVLGGLPPCPDEDADGYFPWEGCGTPVDCDDGDPAVHPGSAEIARDGIDQDCNGYDLTIRIPRAVWSADKRRLRVRAKSLLGRRADLVLEGHGPMHWRRDRRRWVLTVRGVRRDPGTVLVTGREGARAKATLVR